jgi:hypothetical protein
VARNPRHFVRLRRRRESTSTRAGAAPASRKP